MPKQPFASTTAINLAVLGQWMNLLFIPAAAGSIADGLRFSVSQVTTILSVRLLGMFFSLPFYAWLCYHVHRGRLLASTVAVAGVLTMINAAFPLYEDFMTINLLTGVMMGAIHPVGRSLIATFYSPEERGTYYGLIELASGVGGFMGVGVAIVSDGRQNSIMPDWQTVYISIGLVQVAIGLIVYNLLEDPIIDDPDCKVRLTKPTREELRSLFQKRTFTTMVIQGSFGAFPWSGFSFLIIWFERIGLSETMSTSIFAAVALGAAMGGLLGGVIGDRLTRWSPNYGRIGTAFFSVLTGVIFAPCLLFAIPHDKDRGVEFLITGGLMGLFISWPAANNAAIQSNIFPPSLHPTSFAIQFWVEGAFSALCPMAIGFLNDVVFQCGDLMPPGGKAQWDSFSLERKHELLTGMAKSLTVICCVFWILCSLGYVIMYRSYPNEIIE